MTSNSKSSSGSTGPAGGSKSGCSASSSIASSSGSSSSSSGRGGALKYGVTNDSLTSHGGSSEANSIHNSAGPARRLSSARRSRPAVTVEASPLVRRTSAQPSSKPAGEGRLSSM